MATHFGLQLEALASSILFIACLITVTLLSRYTIRIKNISMQMKICATAAIIFPTLSALSGAIIMNNAIFYSVHTYFDFINQIHCTRMVPLIMVLAAFSKVSLNFFYLTQSVHLFKYTRFKLKHNTYHALLIGFGVTCTFLAIVVLFFLVPSFSTNEIVIYAADASHIKSCNIWVPIKHKLYIGIHTYFITASCWSVLLIQQSLFLYIYYTRYNICNTNMRIIIYGRIANTIVEWILFMNISINLFYNAPKTMFPDSVSGVMSSVPFYVLELILMIISLITSDITITDNMLTPILSGVQVVRHDHDSNNDITKWYYKMLLGGEYTYTLSQSLEMTSNNSWLPILIYGYIKRMQIMDFIIPISIIDLCEVYCKAKQFSVGDKMILQNGIKGIIKYIGIPEFKRFYSNQYVPMEIIGIETDKWYVNLGNGVVDNVKYFHSRDGYAYFIQSVKIWKYYDVNLMDSWQTIWKYNKVKSRSELNIKSLHMHQRVRCKNGLIGDIKFIGSICIGSGSDSESKTLNNTIGLELIDFSPNALSDGYISGKCYLDRKVLNISYGRIYFVSADGIAFVYNKDKDKSESDQLSLNNISSVGSISDGVEIMSHPNTNIDAVSYGYNGCHNASIASSDYRSHPYYMKIYNKSYVLTE